MCYLPKATFYIYFATFLFGYLWLLGVLVQKYIFTHERAFAPQEAFWVDTPRLPQPLFYASDFAMDLAATLSPNLEAEIGRFCVPLVALPAITLCTHDPRRDRLVSATVHSSGVLDTALTAWVVQFLQEWPEAVLVDIGAGLGYYTFLATSLGHKALAVEPLTDNNARFQKSAQLNGGLNLTTLLAVGIAREQRHNLTLVQEGADLSTIRALDSVNSIGRSTVVSHSRAIRLTDVLSLVTDSSPILLRLNLPGNECEIFRDESDFSALFSAHNIVIVLMHWPQKNRLDSSLNNNCVSRIMDGFIRHNFLPFLISDLHNYVDKFVLIEALTRPSSDNYDCVLWKIK